MFDCAAVLYKEYYKNVNLIILKLKTNFFCIKEVSYRHLCTLDL